ncbi:hypothetical protein [Desertivirga xinjiangensis]|uniref:hypothetical protein n=1 Tax=Desertivirga xinjiangensis TaxID=539206 RepID=UPI00210B3C97|nr:hypothetical protein [Pedobacter xinjiangensis]
MKKVLIISPYFPPSNAADMQRVRMSLSYFQEFGWEPEVVHVAQKHSDINKDPLLSLSFPDTIVKHPVNALSKTWTSKIGLGSIAIRSLLFYYRTVNNLLQTKKFDLIYFSTTQFPVCILGAVWKEKFRIPYVIDMQDPWHSNYYLNKPKHERPPKYWFSYRLNKILEPIAMKKVGGLISVSDAYINTLRQRYNELRYIPTSTITFGAFPSDSEIVKNHLTDLKPAFKSENNELPLVYIGRGGKDMHQALNLLFSAFKRGLSEDPDLFKRFKFFFIGTSYAPKGQGKKSIAPLAAHYGLETFVVEQTDRIPFYQGLASLEHARGLVVPGSDDPAYTASKLYPYITANKPLLGLFHKESSAVKIMKECNAGEMITLDTSEELVYSKVKLFLQSVVRDIRPDTDWKAFEPYTAREMTKRQCDLFNDVLEQFLSPTKT